MWFWRTFDSIQYVKLIFKCSKSTSKKYDFKKSNTHFSSPWVLDYTCKKVEWSVEPDYQKYPSFMAMSGCQNKRSILNKPWHAWIVRGFIETLNENGFELIINKHTFLTTNEHSRLITKISRPHIRLTNCDFVQFLGNSLLFCINILDVLKPEYKTAILDHFQMIEWPLRPEPIPYIQFCHLDSIIHKISLNPIILSKLISYLSEKDLANLCESSPFLKLKTKYL